MNNTVTKNKIANNVFQDLIGKSANAKILASFLKGDLSLKDFKKTSIFNRVLDISKKYSTNEFGQRICESQDWNDFHDINMCHNFIESMKDKKSIVELIKNCLHDYECHKSLIPSLVDQDFIKAVNKDKKHIANMKKAFNDLAKKCPASAKFINIGWFDEPWMNGNTKKLIELLDKSLQACDRLVKEENNGKFHHKTHDVYDVFGLESGQSDSWDEWVHVFPNTIEYLFCFSVDNKLKKHEHKN